VRHLAGIDTDTFGVYIVTVPLEGAIRPERIGWEAIELRPRTTTKGRSLASTFEAVVSCRLKILGCELLNDPENQLAVAWIEHGYGGSRRNDFEQGRVQGAVAATLGDYMPVNEVNVGTWKKDVIGNGAAKKDQVREFLAARGWFFPRQDLYDAFGIAVYGRLINDKITGAIWSPTGDGTEWGLPA